MEKDNKPQTNKPKKIKLRVGQFNVLNLVRAGVKFYGNNSYSEEVVNKKIRWIAHQLQSMDAGIVGFEEVFHTDVLQKAVDESGLYKGGQVVCFGDGSGPSVALVSQYEIVEKKSIADFPKESLLSIEGAAVPITKFSRPILRCVIKVPGDHEVTVFVMHLKSKRPIVEDNLRHDQKAKALGHARSLIIRAAESAAVRCILVDEMRNNSRPVIVLGDLNDSIHSVTGEILTGTPPWKILPRKEKEDIWDVLLWSTNDIQVRNSDRDVTYSHIHNGRYEVLDHVLVSQEFVRTNPNHIGYVQYLQMFNDHVVDETFTEEKRDNIKSDHGQIVASIKMYPKEYFNQANTVQEVKALRAETTESPKKKKNKSPHYVVKSPQTPAPKH
jgi:endonuclease/exonuclease/phosphatase family metal-dependent hydrolase